MFKKQQQQQSLQKLEGNTGEYLYDTKLNQGKVFKKKKKKTENFPHGPVLTTLCSTAEGMSLIFGRGAKMLGS